MPKSLVGSVIGFADQLQLSHLKLQQAIAKAKPDGLNRRHRRARKTYN